jgi:hypothetical protein
MKEVVAFALLLVLASCGDPIFGHRDTIVCTQQYAYGIAVYVKDSLTGAWAGSGATLVNRDAQYADSSTVPLNRADLDSLPLLGAGERAGVYLVTVRKAGYVDWVRRDVRVSANECHVISVTLTARLSRPTLNGP